MEEHLVQAGAVTTVEECLGQVGAVHKAEGENSLSTVEEQVAQVDASQETMAQEEYNGENAVTTAERLAAVLL